MANIPIASEVRNIPCRLSVFAFIWACQALVHQTFYADWAVEASLWGWLVTTFAIATLLFPSSLTAFVALLSSSIAHSIDRWPFVVNHILLDVVIESTILIAILGALLSRNRRSPVLDNDARNQLFDRFAPVVGVMLVVLYYVIFLSKLNWDFFDLGVSCIYPFYQDVLDKFPFLPSAENAAWLTAMLAIFLIIEIVLPVMLTVKRWRLWALLIGLPFHLLLGIVGHWTFSAIVYGMYAVFLMVPLTHLLADIRERFSDRYVKSAAVAARILATVAFAYLASQILLFDPTQVTEQPWDFVKFSDHPWFFDFAP